VDVADGGLAMDPTLTIAASGAASLVGQWLSSLRERQFDARAQFVATPEGKSAAKIRLLSNICALVCLAVGLSLLVSGLAYFDWATGSLVALVALPVVAAVVIWFSGHLYYEHAFKLFLPTAATRTLQRLETEKKLIQDMGLPNLIALNREAMAIYHGITTRQARTAARNSQAAMGIGFAILAVGALIAIRTDDRTSKIVIGALASIGGVFSGFISRTFLMAQQKAMEQLYRYWKQPLSTSYLLSAERIADNVSDQAVKDQMLAQLIAQMLTAALLRDDDKPLRAVEPVKVVRRREKRNPPAPTTIESITPASENRAVSDEQAAAGSATP
jgi:hypothetical protein